MRTAGCGVNAALCLGAGHTTISVLSLFRGFIAILDLRCSLGVKARQASQGDDSFEGIIGFFLLVFQIVHIVSIPSSSSVSEYLIKRSYPSMPCALRGFLLHFKEKLNFLVRINGESIWPKWVDTVSVEHMEKESICRNHISWQDCSGKTLVTGWESNGFLSNTRKQQFLSNDALQYDSLGQIA